jgi:hypothetical protein
LDWHAAVRSNLELARGLALSSDVSLAHAKEKLQFDLQGIDLNPPAGSTPAGLADSVLDASLMPVSLPICWNQKQLPLTDGLSGNQMSLN